MLSFPERSGILRKWLNIVKEISNNKNVIMLAKVAIYDVR